MGLLRGPIPVLLLGATGQVGSEVRRRADPERFSLVAHSSADLDITEARAVEARVAALNPSVVVNAAAYTAVDAAETEKERALAVNRDGPAHLAAACRRAGIPLIHLSTDYILAGDKSVPYPEEASPRPLNVYGQSKWEGEQAVAACLREHLILRVSWVFGAHGRNFVKTMLRLARERDEIKVVADQQGAPTWAGHIADVALTLVDRAVNGQAEWGTFHYRGTPATTWYEFARAILARARALGLLDREVTLTPLRTAEFPTPAQRPGHTVLETRKLKRVYDLSPGPWQEGLEAVLEELGQG